MPIPRPFVSVLAPLLCLIACSGCGKADKGYVSGTVTLNGQPAGPGTIRFYSTNTTEQFPRTPVGSIGEDGRYELIVSRSEKGLDPGEYQVTVSDKATEVGTKPKPGTVVIPARYNTPKDSKLTARVEPGTQILDFTLEP